MYHKATSSNVFHFDNLVGPGFEEFFAEQEANTFLTTNSPATSPSSIHSGSPTYDPLTPPLPSSSKSSKLFKLAELPTEEEFNTQIEELERQFNLINSTRPIPVEPPLAIEFCGYNHPEFRFDNYDLRVRKGEKIGIVGKSSYEFYLAMQQHRDWITLKRTKRTLTVDGLLPGPHTSVLYIPPKPQLSKDRLINLLGGLDNFCPKRFENSLREAGLAFLWEAVCANWDLVIQPETYSRVVQQKLMLARALYLNISIIVFEQNSEVFQGDLYKQLFKEGAFQSKTILFGLHYLDNANRFNRILVFDPTTGHQVEEGHASILLEDDTSYFKHLSGGMPLLDPNNMITVWLDDPNQHKSHLVDLS